MISKLEDIKIRSNEDRVILLIRHLGIKQYELARELGYSPVYVESVINGRSPFTEAFQNRIDTYLEKRQKERVLYAEKMLNLPDTTIR